MLNINDCPGFENLGTDVQQAREAVCISRRKLAERVGINPLYHGNIGLCSTIPGVPVVMRLIRVCGLPAKRYFNPSLMKQRTAQADKP